MIIVKELSSEFKIELPAEFVNTLPYLLRLTADISGVVKTDLLQSKHPFDRAAAESNAVIVELTD